MAGIRAFKKRPRKKAKRQPFNRKEIALEQIVPLLPLIDRVIYTRFRWALPKIKAGIYDIHDLRQEGVLGMIRAIELYNPKKGRLANYARWHISGTIGRFLRSNSFPNITIPSRAKRRLSFLPIDAPISPHDPRTPGDLISFEADRLHNLDDELLAPVRKLAFVLKRISKQDRQLLQQRFGICDCDQGAPGHHHNPKTLREIGKNLGISRETARRRLQLVFVRLRRVVSPFKRQFSSPSCF